MTEFTSPSHVAELVDELERRVALSLDHQVEAAHGPVAGVAAPVNEPPD